MESYLVIGLGNPGAEYAATRHNIGWMVLDTLAQKTQARFYEDAASAAAVAEVTIRGQHLVLAKPLTYMNRSGYTVERLLQDTAFSQERLLVVVDDLALPLGLLRIRGKGSSGGHNGLKSIVAHLGTEVYARLRLGIGDADDRVIDHVLGSFAEAEWPVVKKTVSHAAEAVVDWAEKGLAFCQNVYNRDDDSMTQKHASLLGDITEKAKHCKPGEEDKES